MNIEISKANMKRYSIFAVLLIAAVALTVMFTNDQPLARQAGDVYGAVSEYMDSNNGIVQESESVLKKIPDAGAAFAFIACWFWLLAKCKGFQNAVVPDRDNIEALWKECKENPKTFTTAKASAMSGAMLAGSIVKVGIPAVIVYAACWLT